MKKSISTLILSLFLISTFLVHSSSAGDENCEDVEVRVRKVLSEQLGVEDEEEVKPDQSFVDDLGAEEPEMKELKTAFEREFGIEILEEDMEKLTSGTPNLQATVDYICSRVGNN